jgi:hypothetical protein
VIRNTATLISKACTLSQETAFASAVHTVQVQATVVGGEFFGHLGNTSLAIQE